MNETSWRLSLFGLLIGGLLACTFAPAADSERAALETAIHRWVAAVNAQDAAVLTSAMTDDVELFDANGATWTGRDAVMRALREHASRGRLIATSREMNIVDDVAWHVAALTESRKGDIVVAAGQALEIWKRVNGEWRLHRRMVTGAPGAELTRPPTSEPVLDRSKE
jgi:ketosteroid isomerase-like protein